MIVNPDGDVTNFVPISVRKEIVTVDVEKSRTYDPDWKVTRDSAHMVPSKDDVLLGKEFPVYTESGTVIGRARIGVDRVTILGSKWAQRTA